MRLRQVSCQHNREIEKRASYFLHCELCSKALKSSQESTLRTVTWKIAANYRAPWNITRKIGPLQTIGVVKMRRTIAICQGNITFALLLHNTVWSDKGHWLCVPHHITNLHFSAKRFFLSVDSVNLNFSFIFMSLLKCTLKTLKKVSFSSLLSWLQAIWHWQGPQC